MLSCLFLLNAYFPRLLLSWFWLTWKCTSFPVWRKKKIYQEVNPLVLFSLLQPSEVASNSTLENCPYPYLDNRGINGGCF
jgi:hypothetical protein